MMIIANDGRILANRCRTRYKKLPGMSGSKVPTLCRTLRVAQCLNKAGYRQIGGSIDVLAIENHINQYRVLIRESPIHVPKQHMHGLQETITEENDADAPGEEKIPCNPAGAATLDIPESSSDFVIAASAVLEEAITTLRALPRMSEAISTAASAGPVKTTAANGGPIARESGIRAAAIMNTDAKNYNEDLTTNSQYDKLLQQVSAHRHGEMIPREVLSYIGGEVHGNVICYYSKVPMYSCNIQNIAATCPAVLREFIKAGVYSVPCRYMHKCNQWMFFRQADYGKHVNMTPAWEQNHWHRTKTKPKYFICPACRAMPSRCELSRQKL